MAVLEHEATPPEALVDFADHPSALLRAALASRPDLSPEVYERLAADPVPGVRADLAENPALDDALIDTLAADLDDEVRRRLCRNPGVTLDVLARLTAGVKTGATLLPRIASAIPEEVKTLALSPSPTLRMLVAQRRDLPPGIRDALATDPDAKVLKSIAPHPGLPEALLRTMLDRHGPRVATAVATNPIASSELLTDLVHRQPPISRALREVAGHPNATAPALLRCLEDARARPITAAHAALPPQTVKELLSDTDPRVAEAAATNPSLPQGVMRKLIPAL